MFQFSRPYTVHTIVVFCQFRKTLLLFPATAIFLAISETICNKCYIQNRLSCKDKKEVKLASLCTLIYVLLVSRSAIAEVGPATIALQSLSILPNLVGTPLY